MLLCGSDLVESFLQPGVWKPDQLRAILEDHGVVCITRCYSDIFLNKQLLDKVLTHTESNLPRTNTFADTEEKNWQHGSRSLEAGISIS